MFQQHQHHSHHHYYYSFVLLLISGIAYAQFNGDNLAFFTTPSTTTIGFTQSNSGDNNSSNVRYEFKSRSNTTRRNISSLYGLTVNLLEGQPLQLQKLRNQCLLVVNTASASIVSQFNMRWFNELHKRIQNGSLAGRLAILAVPSDTFGEEPLRGSALKSWFDLMNTNFDVLQLTDLNQSPLYRTLASAADDLPVFNNFNKYLVWRNGSHVELFTATAGPEENWQTKVGSYETLTGRIENCVSEIRTKPSNERKNPETSTTPSSDASSSSSPQFPSTPSLLGRFKRFAGRDWDRNDDEGWDNGNDAENEEDNAMNIDGDDEYRGSYNNPRYRRAAQEYGDDHSNGNENEGLSWNSGNSNQENVNGNTNGEGSGWDPNNSNWDNNRRKRRSAQETGDDQSNGNENEGLSWDPNNPNQGQTDESVCTEDQNRAQTFMLEELRKNDDDDEGTPDERGDDVDEDGRGHDQPGHHHHHHHHHRHNESSTTDSSNQESANEVTNV